MVKTVTPAVSNSIQMFRENVNQVYTSVNHAIQNEIDKRSKDTYWNMGGISENL